MMTKSKPTKAEIQALEMARDHGHAYAKIAIRRRAGGAYSRMINRMVLKGWLTKAPHEITDEGRSVLS